MVMLPPYLSSHSLSHHLMQWTLTELSIQWTLTELSIQWTLIINTYTHSCIPDITLHHSKWW